jgi:8-oxo-dGTP pyrophosphatase MutT (NUDIX family)
LRRVVAIRLSEEELAVLRITAQRRRESLSATIRALALSAARVEEAEEQLEAARREAFRLAGEQRRRLAALRRKASSET